MRRAGKDWVKGLGIGSRPVHPPDQCLHRQDAEQQKLYHLRGLAAQRGDQNKGGDAHGTDDFGRRGLVPRYSHYT